MSTQNNPVLQAQELIGEHKNIVVEFREEFLNFSRCRNTLRRFAPTPDQFPLFCAMVDAVKQSYVTLPRIFRLGKENKYIPFSCYGREWLVHKNDDIGGNIDQQIFIDLCDIDKSRLVTVAIGLHSHDQESESIQARVVSPLTSLSIYGLE